MRTAPFAMITVAAFMTACNGGGKDGPTPTPCSGGACVVAISAVRSANFACALLQTGEVKCWGSNSYGQLGNTDVPTGTGQRSLEPVSVTSVEGATAIVVGDWNGCAVVGGGAVKCWGDNLYGQLGYPTPEFQASPRQIRNLSGSTTVSAGDGHACVFLSGGAMRCWGRNDSGQLGAGTTALSYDPVPVASVEGATAIVAGGQHTCAIVNGGAVKCWGNNSDGQLGSRSVGAGSPTSHSVDPVVVTSLTGAMALAAGDNFTCALLGGGRVKCWGDNTAGQLGTATAHVIEPDPVLVGTVVGATAIAAGMAHACAIVEGGAVKCWGHNTTGQLGNGSTTGTMANRLGWTAEDVAGLTGVSAISAASWHTCALVRGKGVKCWGANESGQVGDGTTTDRYTPVDVVF